MGLSTSLWTRAGLRGMKHTVLHPWHVSQKARMMGFAGYDMPIQYTSVIDEHKCVRERVGLFDVSHMGLVRFEGARCEALLNRLVTKNLEKLAPGRAAYTFLLNESGGTLDDLIVYRSSEAEFYMVFNASNKDSDLAHILEQDHGHLLRVESLFDNTSIFALQGPHAPALLQKLGLAKDFKSFDFFQAELDEIPVLFAATGYTGEKGGEIFVSNEYAAKLWERLMDAGQEWDIQACGLACRDSLRLEMGYPLHGQDLSPSISPIEAGLKWAVDMTKDDFLGKPALEQQVESPSKKWVGLKLEGRQAPRPEMKIVDSADNEVGIVTSGSFAPSLGHAIGMGLISHPTPKENLFVVIRDKKIPFECVKRPFYNG